MRNPCGQYFFILVLTLLALPMPAYSVSLSSVIQRAKESQLAQDPQWLKLGHYKKSLLGGYKSQVIGDSFFLSAEGKKSPEKELIATLEGFFNGSVHEYILSYGGQNRKEKQLVRCQFPARFIWLKERLGFNDADLPKAECEELEKFKTNLGAKSISVVFSSYFVNNPSSTFGHSFLRINKQEKTDPSLQRYELLDHGINFAAEVTTNNALIYSVFGLVGLFHGTFSNIPYYYKVREYNDFESRDLWSYDLNLLPNEIDLLVAHLWEVGPTYFDYYYFTQNCSYQILTVLEAAAPRYSITEHLPSLYVIPGDTIKQLLKTPGLVKDISFRPSVYSEFQERMSRLSQEEKDQVEDAALHKNLGFLTSDGTAQSRQSRARVLDTALDYMDFRHPGDLLKKGSESNQWKQKLLVARAALSVKSEELKFKPSDEEAPHFGHDSFRLGLETGAERNLGAYSQLKLRFALHDFLDPAEGYPKNSQIEFMNLSARYLWAQQRLEIEEATLFRVMTLNPVTAFNKDLSWRISVGAKRIRDQNCDRCLGSGIEMGGGYAIEPFTKLPVVFYALAEFESTYSPSLLGSPVRVGAGPYGGILVGRNSLKWILESRYRYELFSFFPHTYQFNSEVRQNFSQKFALSFRATTYSASNEMAFTGFIYF